jgi:hypothetical protein
MLIFLSIPGGLSEEQGVGSSLSPHVSLVVTGSHLLQSKSNTNPNMFQECVERTVHPPSRDLVAAYLRFQQWENLAKYLDNC